MRREIRLAFISVALAISMTLSQSLAADESRGPFGIDRRYSYDDHGIWARNTQLRLQTGVVLALTATALYEGSSSRLGELSWQAIDSMLLTIAATQVLKATFSRTRPDQTNDPAKFFQGNGNRSFPSGEVSNLAAIAMPFALEYGSERPWVVAAASALVAYDAVARVKTRGHWPSDVIAGALLGGGIGWAVHHRIDSFQISAFPGRVFVSLSLRF